MVAKHIIAIMGMGYVGLSNAILLAQNNKVYAFDIDAHKVEMINKRISPIVDADIQEYLSNKDIDLTATTNVQEALQYADYVIISTPTNYDEEKNYFDTKLVEDSIETILSLNKNAVIVIKSTIPIGFTQSMCKKYNYDRILFSPEFLREGHALYDNLNPSRIIVGIPNTNDQLMECAKHVAGLLSEGATKENIPVLFAGSGEAEAIKLFANTYLAMRVSFFNELDTFAERKNLCTKEIIDGVSLDPRIGSMYNNPSFGYGGYCLPKDTKQLLADFEDVPENLISAIVNANETRKKYIAKRILTIAKENTTNSKTIIGIYRLIMKTGSDNFRQSAIQDVIKYLHQAGAEIIVYEPTLMSHTFDEYQVVNDIDFFKKSVDIVVANRLTEEISDISNKVYSRDIYSRD